MKTVSGIKAVIFDMDGLMFDTEPIYHRSWYEAAKELGYYLEKGFFRKTQGRNNTDAESILIQHTSPDFDLKMFRKKWKEKWFRIGTDEGINRKEGLTDLLNLLKSENVPMGLATSSNREIMDFCLNETGLRSFFRTTVCGQDVARGKPEPDIYLEAAKRLNTEPVDCIVLEDSSSGALAGINAHMRVILIPDQVEPGKEIKQQVSYICSSLFAAIDILKLNETGTKNHL